MEEQVLPYRKQIFVCTNDKKGEKPSCGDHNSEEIFRELRKIAVDKGLHPNVRVAQAKCLGKCAIGCNIMIFPDNIWISGVRKEDIPEIAKRIF